MQGWCAWAWGVKTFIVPGDLGSSCWVCVGGSSCGGGGGLYKGDGVFVGSKHASRCYGATGRPNQTKPCVCLVGLLLSVMRWAVTWTSGWMVDRSTLPLGQAVRADGMLVARRCRGWMPFWLPDACSRWSPYAFDGRRPGCDGLLPENRWGCGRGSCHMP